MSTRLAAVHGRYAKLCRRFPVGLASVRSDIDPHNRIDLLMIIKPRVRGFLCVTSHPAGCDANIKRQIDYVTSQGPIAGGPKRVLVIGASTGYGLSSRITAAFGCGADTLGIFFELSLIHI